MQVLNETQVNVLLALARFRFLSTSQLHRLVKKEIAWLRKQVSALVNREKPFVERITFGFHPKEGKLENVYFLTKYGKAALLDLLKIDESQVKMPVGNSSLFYKDYKHRKNTIDFHIALYEWTQGSEYTLDFFDTYFDKVGNNRKDKNLRAKTKIDLLEADYLIADGVFTISNASNQFLYLFEMHDGKDSARVIQQLKKHAQAIALGTPSKHYNMGNKSHRVLSVFEFISTKNAVLERIKAENYFVKMPNHFLFKSIETLENPTFSEHWENIKGKSVDFV